MQNTETNSIILFPKKLMNNHNNQLSEDIFSAVIVPEAYVLLYLHCVQVYNCFFWCCAGIIGFFFFLQVGECFGSDLKPQHGRVRRRSTASSTLRGSRVKTYRKASTHRKKPKIISWKTHTERHPGQTMTVSVNDVQRVTPSS